MATAAMSKISHLPSSRTDLGNLSAMTASFQRQAAVAPGDGDVLLTREVDFLQKFEICSCNFSLFSLYLLICTVDPPDERPPASVTALRQLFSQLDLQGIRLQC